MEKCLLYKESYIVDHIITITTIRNKHCKKIDQCNNKFLKTTLSLDSLDDQSLVFFKACFLLYWFLKMSNNNSLLISVVSSDNKMHVYSKHLICYCFVAFSGG